MKCRVMVHIFWIKDFEINKKAEILFSYTRNKEEAYIFESGEQAQDVVNYLKQNNRESCRIFAVD